MPIDPQHELRLWLGLYELEIARHLRRLAHGRSRCFDVGAQYGYDALVLARLSGGEVVSFEADPALIPRMRLAFDLNPGLRDRLTAVDGFVGSGDGATISLDTYSGDRPPDFIKIDVEGAEMDVLRGAEDLLRDAHPALVIETHSAPLERECGEALLELGYSPTIVHQRRVFPDLRPAGHNRWLVAA